MSQSPVGSEDDFQSGVDRVQESGSQVVAIPRRGPRTIPEEISTGPTCPGDLSQSPVGSEDGFQKEGEPTGDLSIALSVSQSP